MSDNEKMPIDQRIVLAVISFSSPRRLRKSVVCDLEDNFFEIMEIEGVKDARKFLLKELWLHLVDIIVHHTKIILLIEVIGSVIRRITF
jgi:hypothetical protein